MLSRLRGTIVALCLSKQGSVAVPNEPKLPEQKDPTMSTLQKPRPSTRSDDLGATLLKRPTLNKGTAFTPDERSPLGLHGLLPPHVETLDQQAARAYEAYKR